MIHFGYIRARSILLPLIFQFLFLSSFVFGSAVLDCSKIFLGVSEPTAAWHFQNLDLYLTKAGETETVIHPDIETVPLAYERALAASSTPNDRYENLLISKDGKPLGNLLLHALTIPKEHLGLEPTQTTGLRGSLERSFIKFALPKQFKILVMGDLNLSGPHSARIHPDATQEIQGRLPNVMEYVLKHHPEGPFDAVILKDLNPAVAKEHPKAYGNLIPVPTEPVMNVPIKWKTFEEYTQGMIKKYRDKARQARQKGQPLLRKTLTSTEIETHNPRIQELWHNVWNRSKMKKNELPPEYFLNMKKLLGSQFELIGYFLEEKLVGFATRLYRNTDLHAQYIGMDYDVLRSHELYKNILYDHVEAGILAGSNNVDLGRTAAETKSERGGIPEEYSVFLQPRSKIYGPLIKWYLKRQHLEESKIHSVFKDE